MQNKIEYEKAGRGVPFILLHGWGMNARLLSPLANRLCERYQVLNVSLPGYGKQQWDSDLSLDDQAKIVGEQLPAGRILGWSLGGLLTIALMKHFPGKFDAVLVCCNPCFVKRSDFESGIDEKVFDQFAADLNRDWALTMRRFLSLQMLGVNAAKQTVRQMMQTLTEDPVPDPAVLNSGLQILKETDLRQQLRSTSTAVKWILGGRDTLVPRRVADDILLLNSQFHVECVAAAGHAPFLSHPDEFLSLL